MLDKCGDNFPNPKIEIPKGNDPNEWLQWAKAKFRAASTESGIVVTSETRLSVPQLGKMFGRLLQSDNIDALEGEKIIEGSNKVRGHFQGHPEFDQKNVLMALVHVSMEKANKDRHAMDKVIKAIKKST